MNTTTGILERCRITVFSWRDSLSVRHKAEMALLFAALTGIAAQLRLPLYGTPVPVTGQVFAVLMCGALLGGGWAELSMAFYVGLGFAGMPWFSGSAGGAALTGVTGGYILGFLPAALFIGFFAERVPSSALRPLLLTLVMLGGVAVIYFFGALQFAAFTRSGISRTFSLAVIPFIPWDIAKALLAGLTASAMLPRERRQ